MRHADWYFDFISPYVYFAMLRLDQLPADVEIQLKPLLFAGLLNHWGQKGPAEISAKRIWTYRSCAWTAQTLGIPFRAPAAHPFNPLPYLRLAIGTGATLAAVRLIFEALWTTGADLADPAVIAALAARLSVPPEALNAVETKQTLRANTEQAAAAGVFGVPTLLIDGELFWGVDGMDFAQAYLVDPLILATAEMQRIATLPIGASRV
ncbi:MAG: 2-hydroxychromene-2-carboxylate isomerase [Nevskia sp.]|nr:2-hydroxychromene-2-carboxylate isomerase [Nevskia sp.]